MVNAVTTRRGEVVKAPSFITNLFNHPLAGLLWLPIRVWLGWQWISASLHKFESPDWMQTGVALKGYAMTVHPDNPMSPIHFHITDNPAVSVLAFAMLAGSLYYFARKPLKK